MDKHSRKSTALCLCYHDIRKKTHKKIIVAHSCLQIDINGIIHAGFGLPSIVFLVKHALNSKATYSQMPGEQKGWRAWYMGAWEEENEGGRSEIPEVLGKFCPSINRLWSL